MYTIAQLQRVMAWAKTHPTATCHIPTAPIGQQEYTGAEWRAWFGHCLMRKINRVLPPATGRKHDPDWLGVMWHASRQLNSRTVIHWLPRELRERFAHRLDH